MATRSLVTRRLMPFMDWAGELRSSAVLRADAAGGITNAVIALPQVVAYALIAGLPPAFGLYTAIVAAVVAALFGSSRHLVTGPAAPMSIMVAAVMSGIVAQNAPGYAAAVVALTAMVGVLQLALGLARFGALIAFISHAVVVGFTAGAAAYIAVTQMDALLGLDLGSAGSIPATVIALARALPRAQPDSMIIGGATLLVTAAVRRLRPRWPALLLGLAAGTLVQWLPLAGMDTVPTVGAMPSGLPSPALPALGVERVRQLAPGAMALALIGLIEAVSIATAIGTRSGQRIDGNREFIGQGLANLVGSFFSCYPASGSFTRSAANFDAGARTPFSGLVTAACLAAVLVLVPGITAYVPMAAVAAMVLTVAWGLVEWGQIRHILRTSRDDAAVLVITLLLTILLGFVTAVFAGILASIVLYLRRTARPALVPVAPREDRAGRDLRNVRRNALTECPQLKILRVDGSLFFATSGHLHETLRAFSRTREQRHVLLVGSAVNLIDVSGAEVLAAESAALARAGGGLYLCSLKGPARDFLERGGYDRRMGGGRLFHNPREAIAYIVHIDRDHEACHACPYFVFRECAAAKEKGTPAA